jgi:Tfp pilus assembly protein PilX
MNQPSAPNPQQPSGSALIIVLLMIVLLATIAVSFLSTARVEQIATRNFTRQTAARGLADLATGEAMATIAEGFTPADPASTAVTVTQPGQIRTYEFSGNGAPVATTNELFPTSDLLAGENFNINTNGIVTGNAGEELQVPWQQSPTTPAISSGASLTTWMTRAPS